VRAPAFADSTTGPPWSTIRVMPPTKDSWSSIRSDAVRAFRVPCVIALVLCGVELVNTFLHHRLNVFGITPRTPFGLIGIVCMPLLHGGWAHVLGNSLALVLFGSTMMLMRPRGEMLFVSVLTALGSGLFVWCIASTGSHHVGFSGVLFGYFGYLVSVGAFERRVGTILLSLSFGLVYGAMVFGVLPGQPGVSWEGHLGGFLSGILAAFAVGRRGKSRPSAAQGRL
jgi:membrane associated rhomboid family serine protease